MARVLCTQYIDGVQFDEPREVAPPIEGDDPPTILARKATGATEKGWTVTWRQDGLAFTAVKQYDDPPDYAEKRRVFEIVED